MTEEADTWKDFQSQFRKLADEERRERVNLSVYGNYEKHPHGEWTYNRHEVSVDLGDIIAVEHGVSKDLEEQFRALATRAGKALHPNHTNPESHWLDRVYVYLLKHNKPGLFLVSEKGGTILRVCAASATLCSRLERHALVVAKAKSKSSNAVSGKPDRHNPAVAGRAVIVRSNPGVQANEMCQIFDRQEVPLPARWLGTGFRTWTGACKNPHYRSKIQTIISKDKRRS
jgi:plasmid stabilization system protein ParE